MQSVMEKDSGEEVTAQPSTTTPVACSQRSPVQPAYPCDVQLTAAAFTAGTASLHFLHSEGGAGRQPGEEEKEQLSAGCADVMQLSTVATPLFTSRSRYALLSSHLSAAADRATSTSAPPALLLTSLADAENLRMRRMERGGGCGEAGGEREAGAAAKEAAELLSQELLHSMNALLKRAREAREERGERQAKPSSNGPFAATSSSPALSTTLSRQPNAAFARTAALSLQPSHPAILQLPVIEPSALRSHGPPGYAHAAATVGLSPRPPSPSAAASAHSALSASSTVISLPPPPPAGAVGAAGSAVGSAALQSPQGGSPSSSPSSSALFNPTVSVRAVLEFYRGHPAARAALSARVSADHEAARAMRGGLRVAENVRQAGEANGQRSQMRRSRERERQRREAVREKRAESEARRKEEEEQQRRRLAATTAGEVGATAQPLALFAAAELAAASAVVGMAEEGRSSSSSPLAVAADGVAAPAAVDGPALRRRALLLWLSLLPTLAVHRWCCERAKEALLPRLRAELESSVDVAASSLLHSALTSRLAEARDAALIVLRRSLASYGLRWQWQRRRKAAVLLLHFLSLVRTAHTIRQALRDSSVLSQILTLQRWWRRQRKVHEAQKVVVAIKWRRREALRSKQAQMQQQGGGSAGPAAAAAVGGHQPAGPSAASGQPLSFTSSSSVSSSSPAVEAVDGVVGSLRERRRPTVGDGQRRGDLRLRGHSHGGAATASSTSASSSSYSSATSVSDVSSVYKALPRAAQLLAVSQLLSERRLQHRQRLRRYFAAWQRYQAEFATKLELQRTKQLLGIDPTQSNAAAAPHAQQLAGAHGRSITASSSLPPPPIRPRFRLLPSNAELDSELSAASRAYFLSRLHPSPDSHTRPSSAASSRTAQPRLTTIGERGDDAAAAVDYSRAFTQQQTSDASSNSSSSGSRAAAPAHASSAADSSL